MNEPQKLTTEETKILLIIKDKPLINMSFKNESIKDINNFAKTYYNVDNDLFKFLLEYYFIECNDLDKKTMANTNDILMEILEKLKPIKDIYKKVIKEARLLSDDFEINLYRVLVRFIKGSDINKDLLDVNVIATSENIDIEITKKGEIGIDSFVYDSKYKEWHYLNAKTNLPTLSALEDRYVKEIYNITEIKD